MLIVADNNVAKRMQGGGIDCGDGCASVSLAVIAPWAHCQKVEPALSL
jgi:hypothetical protein